MLALAWTVACSSRRPEPVPAARQVEPSASESRAAGPEPPAEPPPRPAQTERKRRPVADAPKPAPLPREITNTLGSKLVLIPTGKFVMGSLPTEKDRGDDEFPHEVEITRPFYLGVHEVTQAEYEQVLKVNPSHFAPTGPGAELIKNLDPRRLPVDSVRWTDAVEFCRRLSELPPEKDAGRVYRLPTEAEWEYACRGGCAQAFHTGPDLAPAEANFDGGPAADTAAGTAAHRPVPVGSYQPSSFGLYDMHGNVWEWCADWYGPDAYRTARAQDPGGPASGSHRVIRGGCFLSSAGGCRPACRGQEAPASRSLCVGFRVACVPGPAPRPAD